MTTRLKSRENMKYLLLLLLAAFMSAPSLGHSRVPQCSEGSILCSGGCEDVVLCASNGSHIPLMNCSSVGKLCDPTIVTCQDPENVVCSVAPTDDKYRCRDTGRFPNPYDCYSYFECPSPLPSKPINKTNCIQAERAYDPLSETCRLDSSSRVCIEGPLPACAAEGQRGAVLENPNIYYYCYNDPGSAALVHFMFRCSDPAHIFVDSHCQIPPPPTSSEASSEASSALST